MKNINRLLVPNKIKGIITGLLLFFVPVTLFGQFVEITSIQVIGPYSNRLTDFLNSPAKVIINFHTDVTDQFKVKLLATLRGDNGVEISANPAQLSSLQELTFNRNPVYVVLNALAIRNLFDLEAVTLKGVTYNDLANGSGLPEGNYQLCITPVTAEADLPNQRPAGYVLSDMKCSNPFPITNFEPPYIINPQIGAEIEAKLPQNILFNWSVPGGVKPGIQYNFKMVEIWDSLRNPNDAMQSATDPAFFETTVSSNVLLYGPGNPSLTPGNRYAIMVTAFDPNNRITFRNEGRSEVSYFTFKPTGKNIQPLPLTNIIQNNVNPVNNENNNPIGLIDAPQLDCTCKTTVSDKTVNNSKAKGGSVVHVGAFDMTLSNDVTEKNGSLSGTGTIPVPFLNSGLLKIRVEYSNLQVNSSNQAVTGIVRGKRSTGAAGIMPAYDNPNIQPPPFSSQDIKNIGDFVGNIANKAIADVGNAANSIGWEMPFGIQKEISSEKITVAITDVVFTPEQAGFNACLAFGIPEGGSNNTLALGAKNVCFKDSKGLCGDAILFLVEDFKIDALNLTFVKASGNGKSQAGTYAVFDTDGFKKLHLKAEYAFSQDIIVRQSDKGIVKATFETDITSWNNWYASVNIDPFCITGFEEWGFKLKSPAYYDHSDITNPPDISGVVIEGKTNFQDKSWRGFFFSSLETTLPAIFKRADNLPMIISVKNFIVDNEGITGNVAADNILSITDGDLGGWYYSLDNINVQFVNTSMKSAGLNGKVLLPTSGSPDNTPQDELDYSCTLSKPPSEDLKFQFVIQPKNNLHARLWAATLNVDKASSITVSNDKGSFNATALLNGDLTIEADLSPIPKISFKAVQFQNLRLMTQPPYMTGDVTFGFASPDKSAAGFPVSITGVKPEIKGSSAGIVFNLDIAFTDIKALPTGSFNLGLAGDLTMKNGRPAWGNPHLDVNKIKVSGSLGPLNLSGEIEFFDKDATYGNGIRGNIGAMLNMGVNQVKIDCNIMFGHTTFSYWYADISFLMSAGILISPPVSLFGLGGGMYYNMTKGQDPSPEDVMKGAKNNQNRYTPSANKLGLLASAIVGVGPSGMAFHGKGSFSIQFTHEMGFDRAELSVDAAMLSSVMDDDRRAPIIGHGSISYDYAQKVFNANIFLTVNYASNTNITGSGWMSLNINSLAKEWYFKLGSPGNPININVSDLTTLKAYVMMGSQIGDIPDPPDNVKNCFPDYNSSRDVTMISDTNDPGFAFGAGFDFGPKDLTYLIFYMNISATMGFDVSLKHFKTGCNGSDTPPGINGWYTNGQFYAWAKFKFGLGVDVWFYSGHIDVAEIEAAALFQAGLANPTWFEGWLYGHYNVLDGLISGDMHFHASIGDKCVPEGNPLGSDLPIIAQVKPGDRENDVSIARDPQVAFNFPIGYDFNVKRTNSSGGEEFLTIRINLTNFTVRRKSDNAIIADISNNQNLSFTDEMKLATLYTKVAFDPQTDYTISVSVTATDAKTGQVLMFKGKQIIETSLPVTFKTGDCIHRLDESAKTLLGSYPFKNQRYFLQKEQTTGFIQLNKRYPCLINDPDYDLLAQFVSYQSPSQTKVQEVSVGENDAQLVFQIPGLPNEQITQLRIIKRRKANLAATFGKASITRGSTPANKYLGAGENGASNVISFRSNAVSGLSISNKAVDLELYSYFFKTSKYNKLSEKIDNSDYSAVAVRDGVGNIEGYAAEFSFAEGFDVFDVKETLFDAFGEKFVIYPLVHISEQAPGNAWIRNYVTNYFYSNWKVAFMYGGEYQYDINPAFIRKSATGIQCLIFQPSLEPVGIMPMSAEPPLSTKEIKESTMGLFNAVKERVTLSLK